MVKLIIGIKGTGKTKQLIKLVKRRFRKERRFGRLHREGHEAHL